MATLTITFTHEGSSPPVFTVKDSQGADATNFRVTESQDITWQINQAESIPQHVTFDPDRGIEFSATSSTPLVWHEHETSLPQAVSDTEWTVPDVVNASTRGKFAYKIRVIADGAFEHDPDLTNTPPP